MAKRKYKKRKPARPLDLRARLRYFRVPIEEMTCLDLGCGKNASPLSKQVLEIPWGTLVSIDAWGKNIDVLHAKRAIGEMKATHWIQYTEAMEKIVPRLPKDGYDVVLILDALEHLKKDVGVQFLKDVEALNPKRILIWLPLGDCPQAALEGNQHEIHLSTWTKEELEELGYKVEVFPQFHRHLSPHVDAAWAVKTETVMKKERRKPRVPK